MSWTTTATLPQPKTGPAWTTSDTLPTPQVGAGWFSTMEKVVPFGATGTLSATATSRYPQAAAAFTATGVLGATIKPVKAVAVAFTATGAFTAPLHEIKYVAVAFSAEGSHLGTSINEGLWATVGGGDSLTDGLTADIEGIGGVFDGLSATITEVSGGGPSPVSNFDFHEGSGATATSTVGSYVITAMNSSIAWDGDQAIDQFNGIVGNTDTDDWSVVFDLTWHSTPFGDSIIDQTDGYQVAIGITSSGAPEFYTPGSSWMYVDDVVMTVDVPAKLAFTISGGTTVKAYIDGALAGTMTAVDAYANFTTDSRTIWEYYYKPEGSLNNIAYYDVCLTPTEVAAL